MIARKEDVLVHDRKSPAPRPERRASGLRGRLGGLLLTAPLLALPLLLASCPEGGGGGGSTERGCGHSGYYCPEGFVCNEETGDCDCDGTPGACVEGSVCDVETGLCVCASDDCCPEGYAFDMDTKACACASHECCPPDYYYDPAEGMCVCSLDICCPPGFDVDADGRCLCQSDEACGEGFTCDLDTGDCRCQNDDACSGDEFCNDFGFCQEAAACTSSHDCPDRLVCNPEEGVCISGYCALDSDCPLGRICVNSRCERGCHTSDDCWLAHACIDGHCRGAICDRDRQCGVGEYCDTSGSCVRVEGPYCHQPCGETQPCPGDAHCVGWMVEGDPELFCAPPCGEDNWCPAGFSCGGTYTQCDPALEPLFQICGEHGLECVEVTIHNEPDITHMCGENGQPSPIWLTCGPEAGTCAGYPSPGQTTRPNAGSQCQTLCRDGLVCANIGAGYRCYSACPTGQCTGDFQCQPADNGIDMICVPP